MSKYSRALVGSWGYCSCWCSAFWPEQRTLEWTHTLIPAAILATLIAMGGVVWERVHGPPPLDAAVVDVRAEQFAWLFRYPGPDGRFGGIRPELMTRDNPMGLDPADPVSANDIVTRELHLVVNRPVRLRIRSKDVIHSFFVPHFRLKQDAVPGMTTEISFTPTGRASLKRPARSCAGSATTLCGEKSRSNRRRRLTRGSRNSNDRGCPYNGGGRPPSWCRAANCCFRGTTMLQRKVESRDFGTCSPEGPLSAPAPAPNAPP